MTDFIPRHIDNRNLIASVAEHFGVSQKDMLGEGKHRKVSRSRHACMYVFRNAKGYSLHQIGGVFGRHHTTVLSALKRLEDDPDTKSECERLAATYRQISEFSDRNFYL